MEIDKITKELTATTQRCRKLNEENIRLQEVSDISKKEVKNKRNELKVPNVICCKNYYTNFIRM